MEEKEEREGKDRGEGDGGDIESEGRRGVANILSYFITALTETN